MELQEVQPTQQEATEEVGLSPPNIKEREEETTNRAGGTAKLAARKVRSLQEGVDIGGSVRRVQRLGGGGSGRSAQEQYANNIQIRKAVCLKPERVPRWGNYDFAGGLLQRDAGAKRISRA